MSAIRARGKSATSVALLVFAALTAPTPAFADKLVNRLAQHPSPYLAAHAADPVAWQEWNPATIERARREGKLLFVSLGYFSCHWCHVMQRESYRNRAIAARLNRDFIPVKVDRELDPALDTQLIDFVQNTRGRAGWPLNVFVTPEGAPLHASLYLPPDEFAALLQRTRDLWRQERARLTQLALNASATATAPAGTALTREQIQVLQRAFLAAAKSEADTIEGGFGKAAKFPSVPQLAALLELSGEADSELRAFLVLTLEQMAQNGLRDHLGGGFFRYSTDPGWKTPHFEKMLYDNAQLAQLYWRAAIVFARADFRAIADETFGFMQTVLASGAGDFIGALSAVDRRNIEGGYYLWLAPTLARALGANTAQRFRRAYGMTDAAPFDAGYLPIPSAAPMELAALAPARQKLLAVRERRDLPRDVKRLAAWNGLALSAFAVAAMDSASYRSTATQLATQLRTAFWDGRGLRRALVGRRAIGASALEDYAYIAHGMLEFYRLTRAPDDLAFARAVADAGWQRFYDRGWNVGAEGLRAQAPQRAIEDGALPSPAAVMVDVMLQIAALDRDAARAQRARAALILDPAALSSAAFWHASLIALLARAPME